MALSKILPASQDQFAGARNLIINGAMQVAQRGTSATGQTETSGYKTVDRFQFWTFSGGTYTLSQDSEAPDGFAYSHKVLNTSTTSTVAGTGVTFRHRVEAQDLQQLNYNTSAAKSVTLSFWVRSDTTGTYALRLYNPDSTNIATKTYTISSANTWEKKEIVFNGDTGGVINNDNGYAFEFAWWLAAGTDFTSGSVTGQWEAHAATKEAVGQTVQLNTGGNWYITGVQLELGSATPFEHRSFGDELARCQRYYYQLVQGSYMIVGMNDTTSNCETTFGLPVEMRADPTLGTSGTSSEYSMRQNGSNITCDSGPTILGSGGKNVVGIRFTKSGALNTTYASYCFGNTSGADLKLEAEL